MKTTVIMVELCSGDFFLSSSKETLTDGVSFQTRPVFNDDVNKCLCQDVTASVAIICDPLTIALLFCAKVKQYPYNWTGRHFSSFRILQKQNS